MRISELKSPYKELAELRRKQDGDDLELDTLCAAFRYTDTTEGGEFWARVAMGECPEIPSESLKELHLVDEWVVGEEYEFNHGRDDAWLKGKLIVVLPENYNYRFIVQSIYNENDWACYKLIRPIVKEDPIQKQIEKLEKELAELKQLTSK
jgi:hypothetical protein